MASLAGALDRYTQVQKIMVDFNVCQIKMSNLVERDYSLLLILCPSMVSKINFLNKN